MAQANTQRTTEATDGDVRTAVSDIKQPKDRALSVLLLSMAAAYGLAAVPGVPVAIAGLAPVLAVGAAIGGWL